MHLSASYVIVIYRCLLLARSNDIRYRSLTSIVFSSSPFAPAVIAAAAAAAAAGLAGISHPHLPKRRLRIKATTGCSVHIH